MTIRLAIVDNHTLVRNGLRELAKSAPVEEVLGLLRDGLSVPAIAALMAAVEYGMFVSEPQMSRSAQNGTAPAATAS
jgi:hypothetical protein